MKIRTLLFLLLPLTCVMANDAITDTIRALMEDFLIYGDDEEADVVATSHTIELPDGPIHYTAISGILPQFYNEKRVGELFFTAYLRADDTEEHEVLVDPSRPVTFIFNGGPGGSSLAMHIGGFGPRRLLLPTEGQKPLPPYEVIDNPETLLGETDLIFIDPMGTGYSRADDEGYKYHCYGVEGDLASFREFIRVFCTHFDKWNNPKYLLGVSYGTTRACGLGEYLLSEGLHLNGMILLGCTIDYQTIDGNRDDALSDCLLIPSLAATAWYHGRFMPNQTLEETVEYARQFIRHQSAPMLFHPSPYGGMEQKDYYENLAELIGLPVDTVRRYGARLDEVTYVREFMASERKIIGGTDSRYQGSISALRGEIYEDPSYRDIRPAFYPAFMNYLQNELELKTTSSVYESFSYEAFFSWNWGTYDNFGLPNFLQRLRRTLVANPSMKVFIGSGYYDLRTPFAAAEYSIDHLDLPAHYRDNFQFEYYHAGHGFIFDLPSLQKLKKDLVKFYGDVKHHNSSPVKRIKKD